MTERNKSTTLPQEPSIDELEEGLLIDKNTLDEIHEQHPDLFHRVAKQLTLLISRRDAAKQEKEDVEAQIDAKIRRDAEIAEEKVTEKQIESEKRLHKEVRAAMDRLASLQKQVGQWTALKEAFIQRSYALSGLVDLYTSGYFGANTSGSSARMKEHDADNARREMNRMRRNKTYQNG